MPRLNIPVEEIFGGIQAEGSVDDIPIPNSPDCRNADMSEVGELSTRPGMAKDNATAKSNPPIYDLSYIDIEDTVVDIYIDASGNAVTF